MRPLPLLLLSSCDGCLDDTGQVEVCGGGLAFSEIMSDPAALEDSRGEYLELYNAGSEACTLLGLVLTRVGTDERHTIGQDVVVEPGDFAVLATYIPEDGESPFPVDYDWGSISLTQEAEICLQTEDGATIDCVAYGGAGWPDPGPGVSLSLDPGHLGADQNDDPAVWCASDADLGTGDFGSPGEAGPDCPEVPVCPASATLVVAEVMPDPEAGANEPSGEYLEVYNAGSAEVPVGCVVVYDAGVEPGEGRWAACADHVIPAGGAYVFANDAALVASLAGVPETSICELAFELSNNGEAWGVGFLDAAGIETVLDQVDCEAEDCPYDRGVSMNLSADALDTAANDEMLHWCPSATAFGKAAVQYGTPGGANEICPAWPTLTAGEAFFTELMPRPDPGVGAEHGEYIEAVNQAGEDIPFAHLELLDAGSPESLTCEGEQAWAAGEVLVIARDPDPALNGGFSARCQADFAATDGGDTFALQYTQPDGKTLVTLDTLTYTDDWPFDAGVAMELTAGACFSASANDGSGCWTAATEEFGTGGEYGTPGTAP